MLHTLGRARILLFPLLPMVLLGPGRLMAQEDAAAKPRLKWFQDARFGMFIHWGVYSVLARGEWVMNNEKIPIPQYEPLVQQFNPTKYEPDEWVHLAKAAGQKYITITSKHHDGFCMFDSALTDYDCMSTPAHRDFIGDLVDACHRHGMKISFYYSLLDWHHPDYKTNLPKYLEYAKGQLRELCTKYGKIDGIWFDGGWEHTPEEWHSQELIAMIRQLQPGILVNNRAGWDGDFGTPEQSVPGGPEAQPWEACITINGSWGYNQGDTGYKSATDLVRMLVDIVSKGGNLLLNVGPMPTGEIQPEFQERLRGMGQWLAKNGDSVYGCTQSPLRTTPFGCCTRKGNTLYLHLFEWPDGVLAVDRIASKPLRAYYLQSGERVWVTHDGERLLLHLRGQAPDPVDTVVAVEFAEELRVDNSIGPEADGSIRLLASLAQVHGRTARYEDKYENIGNIGFWTDASDWVSWTAKTAAAGSYRVELAYACDNGSGGSEFVVALGDQKLTGKVQETGGWGNFVTVDLGTLKLAAGANDIAVKPTSKPGPAVMNLRSLVLTPR